ncbi:alpha/beta fold hydrolase [Corynebacterium gerontici]|uniref:FAD-containing monooxygenase EthA n=1 Tax=Corynebacterium gerontici TaxID=2079234 RepID=A0A3G6J3T0_9CORY|nr:alpha/beta fold hydrolase [Corynebacterium gerontici]AZA10754.1 FAD-containing monooxygenase EthA [Corynebacterium gerontici]
MEETLFDVVIIGAGIAGIAVAHHLNQIDNLNWAVLEEKQDFSGTWDTFRYPGVRSDSDIDSYCFSFLPWRGTRPLGTGEEIRNYLCQAAQLSGMSARTRFGHRVESIEFLDGLWRVKGTSQSGDFIIRARWIHLGCGYYDHHQSHQPLLAGEANFSGTIVDPQRWPQDPEHPANKLNGREVAIVGSGATAVTLAPALSELGAKVHLVQRTANHLAAMGDKDVLAPLRRVVPETWVDRLDRCRAIQTQRLTLWLSRIRPSLVESTLRKHREALLSRPEDRQAFEAQYPLWTQRVCRVPDGDLFQLIERGKVQVHTGTIASLHSNDITLDSGEKIPCEVLIKATGLNLLAFGGIQIEVDSKHIDPGQHIAWRGMMLDEVPNLSFTLGYVNDSYTLRAELVGEFLARILQHLRAEGFTEATPTRPAQFEPQRIIDLDSGYVRRGIHAFPVVSDTAPWTLRNNYAQERKDFHDTDVRDGMHFRGPTTPQVRMLRVRGQRVKIQGTGPTIFAVHGIGRELEDFDALSQLVSDDFQVISVDIPGFGQSPRLQESTVGSIASAMWELFDALRGEMDADFKPILVGHSLGGLIVQAMLCQRPHEVAGLLLLAPSGFSEKITPIVRLAARKRIGPAFLGLKAKPVLAAMERAAYADSGRVTASALEKAQRRAQHPDRAGVFAEISAALVGCPPAQRVELSHRAGEIAQEQSVPIRILWGDQDKVISPGNAACAKDFFHTSVEVLEGCGHMVPMERTEACARAIRALHRGRA